MKHLQAEGRFSSETIKFLYLLLYSPIGIFIVLLRTLLGLVFIILGNVLPDVSFTRTLLTNLFRAVFGIIVHTENLSNKDNVKVVISNYISPLDHFVVHTATGCILPYQTNLPSQLSFCLGLKNFGPQTNLEEIKKCIGSFLSSSSVPVLFQPEGKLTNGQGVLKFKDWPFSLSEQVQPLYLQLRRPIFDISISTITSGFWSDMFWYLFSPWTIYNVCFLPVERKGDFNDTDFAENVRQKIATGLMVEACSYGASDVIEWEKRYLLEQRRARMVHNSPSTPIQNNNPELHRMARQVKEVLPVVPYNVIYKDLSRTKNVDITISNILEGHVSYTPEAAPEPSTSSASRAISIAKNEITYQKLGLKDSLCTAASSFPKSAQERMQSFQERKMQLILTARQRYIDKHGITALASNSNNC